MYQKGYSDRAVHLDEGTYSLKIKDLWLTFKTNTKNKCNSARNATIKDTTNPDTYATNSCHERDFLLVPFSANVYINIYFNDIFKSRRLFCLFFFFLPS